jgi:thiamine-phosphate pyrophosphorylase
MAGSSPILCYVTDGGSLANSSLQSPLAVIRSAAIAGVDWIQIREKTLSSRELLKLASDAIAATAKFGSRLIVNDRLDVALAAGAAGVHLGAQSLPIGAVVNWRCSGNVPADFLIGVSCHSLDDSLAAEQAGADYVFFGPVFQTPSKVRFGPPQGLDKLAAVCARVKIPVLAIGGIDRKNGADCVRAGASGIAAIRMFQKPASDHLTREEVSLLRESWRMHGGV